MCEENRKTVCRLLFTLLTFNKYFSYFSLARWRVYWSSARIIKNLNRRIVFLPPNTMKTWVSILCHVDRPDWLNCFDALSFPKDFLSVLEKRNVLDIQAVMNVFNIYFCLCENAGRKTLLQCIFFLDSYQNVVFISLQL